MLVGLGISTENRFDSDGIPSEVGCVPVDGVISVCCAATGSDVCGFVRGIIRQKNSPKQHTAAALPAYFHRRVRCARTTLIWHSAITRDLKPGDSRGTGAQSRINWCSGKTGSGRFNNSTGTDTAGTGLHMHGGTITGYHMNSLQIGQPAATGFIMGVANVVSGSGTFATNFTITSHDIFS